MTLELVVDNGPAERGGLRARLAAMLAAAWAAEMRSLLTLETLEARAPNPQVGARLSVLTVECQTRAGRMLADLARLGGGPLPVPPEKVELPEGYATAVRETATDAQTRAARYASMAIVAGKAMSPSAGWACEQNRSSLHNLAFELLALADAVDRAAAEKSQGSVVQEWSSP